MAVAPVSETCSFERYLLSTYYLSCALCLAGCVNLNNDMVPFLRVPWLVWKTVTNECAITPVIRTAKGD